MRPSLPVAAALVAFVLVAPREASAWCQMTTVAPSAVGGSCSTDGLPLAWNRRCIEYSIDDRGSSDLSLTQVSNVVAASLGTWTFVSCNGDAPGFIVQEGERLVSCQKASYSESGGNVNVVAFVPELDDGSILALTTVWYSTSTGEIFDADILVNELQGPFGVCPATGCVGASAPHDLANVLTHEAGHFFGLAHSTLPDATMYASSSSGETGKRSLTGDDEAGFCATYGDLTLPAECDFTPRGGRTASCGGSSRGCGVTAPSAGPRSGSSALGLLAVSAILVAWGRRRVARALDRRRAPGATSDTLRPRD